MHAIQALGDKDETLEVLVEDYIRATELQRSLKNRIEAVMREKEDKAKQDEEITRLASQAAEQETVRLLEANRLLKERMRRAEVAEGEKTACQISPVVVSAPQAAQVSIGHPLQPLPAPRPFVPAVSTRNKWEAIAKLRYTPQKRGDIWFLVSSTWYQKWKRMCAPSHYRGDDSSLDPVDNSDIVDENGVLLSRLVEETHYEVVCKEAWDNFVEWYGQGSYILPRKIITEGVSNYRRAEIYPYKLYIFNMTRIPTLLPQGVTPYIEISKSDTVGSLIDRIIQLSGLKKVDMRFWIVSGTVLQAKPLKGGSYPSDRIQTDGAQPFGDASMLNRRLDDALVESGDAIVYEVRYGGA
ncbi:CSN-associated deubiquitinating enzyme Ubp12 [Serendipita sp. 397]|nr:CSN-associated deubiquitinating enzyme Ubp12 [Serendipita sp. 397]